MRHSFPFLSRIGRFLTVMNRTLEILKPKYWLFLRNYSIVNLFWGLQVINIGMSAIYPYGIEKLLRILSKYSWKIVFSDFIFKGHRNLSWCWKRLDDPAHKKIKPTKLLYITNTLTVTNYFFPIFIVFFYGLCL